MRKHDDDIISVAVFRACGARTGALDEERGIASMSKDSKTMRVTIRRRRQPKRRRKKCKATGKVRYDDRISALAVLAATQRSRSPLREERRAYQCDECGGWHLTKMRAWHGDTDSRKGGEHVQTAVEAEENPTRGADPRPDERDGGGRIHPRP